jgi:hypothetical protein
MQPVYHCPGDKGWAGHSIVLAKSTAAAGIITIDDDDKDDGGNGSNGGKDGGTGLDWSALDYYDGCS